MPSISGLPYRSHHSTARRADFGRWFSQYKGESYNTGLISAADRPWKNMLVEMLKTNHIIYDLLMGRRPPFAWDDARFRVNQSSFELSPEPSENLQNAHNQLV